MTVPHAASSSLDLLDRLAVLYLTLPLAIFLLGWVELCAALPLVLCMLYSLKPHAQVLRAGDASPGDASPGDASPGDMSAGLASAGRGVRWPTSRLQLAVAIAVGCAWTVCGGTGHLVFANADWHLRDAVLHDLVVGRWPVGYGPLDGRQSLLRAPMGYYLPAALVGKAAGLRAAHAAMAVWTAIGAALFLSQVLSLIPSRVGMSLLAAAAIVLFSGFDVIGTLLRSPGSISHWDLTTHLEWWADSYQYSSMTTQLFWVPNHALGGWLTIGLMARPRGRERGAPARSEAALESLLPIVVVATALWSPLTALGVSPFVLWRACATMRRERSLRLADPRIWAPALAVGIVVALYLTLDTGGIPRSWTIGRQGFGVAAVAMDLVRQAEFFLLEAGFIGFAILAIRPSREVVLALVILALLPFASFGAANDFVMRVSIPSLTVLAVGACLALCQQASNRAARAKRAVLLGLLAVGAVTPFQEIARAVVLEPWPINLDATLLGATCGWYPPHYVARLGAGPIANIMRPPHALPLGPLNSCENPAARLQAARGLALSGGARPAPSGGP